MVGMPHLEKRYLVGWRLVADRAAALGHPPIPLKNWLWTVEEEDVDGQSEPSTSRLLGARGCVHRGKAGGRGGLATADIQKDGLARL